MTQDDYKTIEGSIIGSCATSAVTIERVAISCMRSERNELSLSAKLQEMGFHRIEVEPSRNGHSMTIKAERSIVLS